MIRVQSITELRQLGHQRIALACGVFDGVHLGHRDIVKALITSARETGATPVVLTFSPHPANILERRSNPSLLTSMDHKLHLLESMGVETAIMIPFNETFAQCPADTFLSQDVFNGSTQITNICVGSSWRFGAAGEGNTAMLQDYCDRHNATLITKSEHTYQGRPVSSTRIRKLIRSADLENSRFMLARPHAVWGKVEHGRGLGHKTFHCPTANLSVIGRTVPPNGVYAVQVEIKPDSPTPSKNLPGIAYVGSAPSIDPSATKTRLECHVFDIDQNLYGQKISVEFHGFIRHDHFFETRAALHAQIHEDVIKAKNLLNQSNTCTCKNNS